MKNMGKVNILGTNYSITLKRYDEDKTFERDNVAGYCYSFTKQIVVCDMSTYKGWENEPLEVIEQQQKETLRHEIVHAFFNESGLKSNTDSINGPWARDEELVDWIAIQGPKIYKAWQDVNAI